METRGIEGISSKSYFRHGTIESVVTSTVHFVFVLCDRDFSQLFFAARLMHIFADLTQPVCIMAASNKTTLDFQSPVGE